VWLHTYEQDGKVVFEADSDSVFVKGEIALLMRVLSNQTPDEILNTNLEFIDAIGLRQHLAMTRANGLASMVKQMKLVALGIKSKQSA
jgi:cysteine desulfuration protein SufE